MTLWQPPRSLLAAAVACTLALVLGARAPATADPPPPHAAPPAPVAAPPLVADHVARYRLANGLEVILQEDHRTARVAVHLRYAVGFRDQQPARRGLAHLTEHAMFERSAHLREAFIPALEALGATDYNGVTQLDATTYFETVPAHQLAAALWMESDRMAFLLARLDAAALDRARRAVLNEYRERRDARFAARAGEFLRGALYPAEHPYRGESDDPRAVAAASLDDVRRFFQTWYVPANATLALVGDFTEAEARRLVEQYFGPVRALGDRPARPAAPPVRLAGEQRLWVRAPLPRERVTIVWPTPIYFAPGDAALDLLALALEARLRRRLVRELGAAQRVGVEQVSRELVSEFSITAEAAEGHLAGELLDAIDATLGQLREQPIDARELVALQQGMVTRLMFDGERIGTRAARLASYARFTPGDLLAFDRQARTRYLEVTPAELARTARDLLPASQRVVMLVRYARGAPTEGELATSPAALSSPSPSSPLAQAPAR